MRTRTLCASADVRLEPRASSAPSSLVLVLPALECVNESSARTEKRDRHALRVRRAQGGIQLVGGEGAVKRMSGSLLF